MRKALIMTILLIVLPVLVAVRAYAPAASDGSERRSLVAPSRSAPANVVPDPGRTRRTLGLWLLATTGATVALRIRSSRAIR